MRFLKQLRLYRGIHYPIVGAGFFWENEEHTVIFRRHRILFGLIIHYGIKVKLSNPEKPYTEYAMNKIKNHPEMELTKYYYSEEDGLVRETTDDNARAYWEVMTTNGLCIGGIPKAYEVSHLVQFDTFENNASVIACCGFNRDDKKWYGWSQTHMGGFGIGDRVFDAEYTIPTAPYTQHGSVVITSPSLAKKSAQRLARHLIVGDRPKIREE